VTSTVKNRVAVVDGCGDAQCPRCGSVYVRGYDRDLVVCLATGHLKDEYVPEKALIIDTPYGDIRCIYGGYECPVCQEILPDRHNLAAHMRTHGVMRGKEKPLKVVDESVKCEFCPQLTFSNKNELGAHKRWHHKEEVRYGR